VTGLSTPTGIAGEDVNEVRTSIMMRMDFLFPGLFAAELQEVERQKRSAWQKD
jgi:hypothetical protein